MTWPATSGAHGRLRSGRSGGAWPLIAAVASALVLTGAAFYTVDQASCGEQGRYVRHDNHLELIGGCVSGSELPEAVPNPAAHPGRIAGGDAQNYRP